MKYIHKDDEYAARRMVNFEACGNIDRSGSVKGMQQLYGWPKGGQVRVRGYIYNVGPTAIDKLRNHNLIRG